MSASDVLLRLKEHRLMTAFKSLLAESQDSNWRHVVENMLALGLDAVDKVNTCLGAPSIVDIAGQRGRSDVVEFLRRSDFVSQDAFDQNTDTMRGVHAAMAVAIWSPAIISGHQLIQYLLAAGADPNGTVAESAMSREPPLLTLALRSGRIRIARELLIAGSHVRVCGHECVRMSDETHTCAVFLASMTADITMKLYIIAHLDQSKCIDRMGATVTIHSAGNCNVLLYVGERTRVVWLNSILPIVAATMLRLTDTVRRWLREVPVSEQTIDLLCAARGSLIRVATYDTIAHEIEDTHELSRLCLSLRLPWSPQRHNTFPKNIRTTILVLLCVQQRIGRTRHLPMLPNEIWLHIFSFFSRSWGCTPCD